MKSVKAIAIILAIVMVFGVFAGCGSTASDTPVAPSSAPSSDAPANSGSDSPDDSASGVTIPAVPDLGGMSSNEWLITREDKKPLGGVISTHLNSRADVYKGLDQVDPNDDHVTIGWLSASLGAIFFTERERSAKEACDKYGYEFINFDANFDLTTQTEQLENILTMDIDFLMINATDIDALSVYYKQAADMGIPVFCTGPSSAKDEYNIVTTVLAGSWQNGFVVGEYCAEEFFETGKPVNVGFLIAKMGDADSESRSCGFISGYLNKYAELAGQPYDSIYDAGVIGYNTWLDCRNNGKSEITGIINCVGYVTTGGIDPATAQPKAAELITAHPEMDLILCETSSFGTGIVNECIQAGMIPGQDVKIAYAADGAGFVLDLIKTGEVLCSGTNIPYPCGEDVVELIHSIINDGFDANDLPANSYTPTYVVTADNVDDVYTEGDAFARSLTPWKILTTEEYNAQYGG